MKNIDDTYFKAVSDNFNSIIEERKIDIADIAASANLDRKQVYRLTSRLNVPNLVTLVKISLASGLEPKDLFDFPFDFNEYIRENRIDATLFSNSSNPEQIKSKIGLLEKEIELLKSHLSKAIIDEQEKI